MASKQIKLREDLDLDCVIEVGKEFSKGKTPKQVAAIVDMDVKQVKLYREYFNQLMLQQAKNDEAMQDRLAVAFEEVRHNFDMLLESAWRNKDDAEASMEYSVVNTALRLIKDINESRFQMLQDLTDGHDAEILDELDKMEEQHEQLVEILKGLKAEYPEAAKFVYGKLNEVRGVEVV